MSNHINPDQLGRIRRIWRRLCSPAASWSLLALLLSGFVAGIVFWGGTHTVIGMTNTEEFCISCHEMRDNVYAEYKETTHYSNRSGVRAVCTDCHVPKEWGPMMVRKALATRELWGWMVGSIDTREKFLDKRLFLAEREWKRMRANDSLECRNCHSMESMDTEKQRKRASKSHAMAQKTGETCIDCHQGIAHHKPDVPDDYEDGAGE